MNNAEPGCCLSSATSRYYWYRIGLAIYALIVPLSSRLFERSLAAFLEYIKDVKGGLSSLELKEGEDGGISKAKVNGLIMSSIAFPAYLRYGVGVTFLGYMATTLLCSMWIVNWEMAIADALIVPIFVIATLVFLAIGLMSVRDAKNIMSMDMSQIIERIKKEKASSRNILSDFTV